MQKARIRRHIRRRARMDAALVALAAFAISQPVAEPHASLLVGIAAISVGILFFMVRRSRDMAHFVEAARSDARRLSGSGISVAEWHKGTPLAPWAQRRQDAAHPHGQPT